MRLFSEATITQLRDAGTSTESIITCSGHHSTKGILSDWRPTLKKALAQQDALSIGSKVGAKCKFYDRAADVDDPEKGCERSCPYTQASSLNFRVMSPI